MNPSLCANHAAAALARKQKAELVTDNPEFKDAIYSFRQT